MKNARAVYTKKRSITAGKLQSIAAAAGLELRYLQPGGCVSLRYQDETPRKGLTNPLNSAMLVAGTDESGAAALEELDGYIAEKHNQAIREMLNAYRIPWLELYSSGFDYARDVVAGSKTEAKLIAAIPPISLSQVQTAKTQYLFYNKSRRKLCGDFMLQLAELLGRHVGGTVIEHMR